MPSTDAHPSLPGPLWHALERAAAEAPLEAGDVAAVYGGADRGELAALLAEAVPHASVVVAATDVREAAFARERAARLSNVRVEVVQRLDEAVGGGVRLVALVPGGYEGKERLRAMVGEAATLLQPGGALVIVSHARRGAGTLLKMAEQALGGAEAVARGWGGMRVIRALRADGDPPGGVAAGDAAETEIETELLGRRFRFATAPGVFSRGRVDPGTRLLVESVEVGAAGTVLDLGCGYGAIGIAVAATEPQARVTLVDVDARAVALAGANCERNGVSAAATVADGAAALGASFDLILTHFPLHAPRGDRDRLVREARDALEPGGRFCAVVLEQYDLADTFAHNFPSVQRIAESGGYVVLEGKRGK